LKYCARILKNFLFWKGTFMPSPIPSPRISVCEYGLIVKGGKITVFGVAGYADSDGHVYMSNATNPEPQLCTEPTDYRGQLLMGLRSGDLSVERYIETHARAFLGLCLSGVVSERLLRTANKLRVGFIVPVLLRDVEEFTAKVVCLYVTSEAHWEMLRPGFGGDFASG
jgi:hypothetical protein